MSYYFLLRLSTGCDYKQAIKESIRPGGDTDTNACIVGGLIGAAVGCDGIPSDMRDKVLKFDCTSSSKKYRPDFLSVARHFDHLVNALIEKRQTRIKMPETPAKIVSNFKAVHEQMKSMAD